MYHTAVQIFSRWVAWARLRRNTDPTSDLGPTSDPTRDRSRNIRFFSTKSSEIRPRSRTSPPPGHANFTPIPNRPEVGYVNFTCSYSAQWHCSVTADCILDDITYLWLHQCKLAYLCGLIISSVHTLKLARFLSVHNSAIPQNSAICGI